MNIENSLSELGLSNHNIGTSTGINNFSNVEKISSYSPVDGKEISWFYYTKQTGLPAGIVR